MGCHAALTWHSLGTDAGISLGFFKIFDLLALAINTACVIALIWRPLQNLLVVLFPLSAVAVLVATLGPDTPRAALSARRGHAYRQLRCRLLAADPGCRAGCPAGLAGSRSSRTSRWAGCWACCRRYS
jgi:hypothetical protein